VIGCNVCFFSDQIGTCIGQLVIIDDTSFYFLMFSLSLGVGLLKPHFLWVSRSSSVFLGSVL
jgi:hypothetical protein